MIDLHSLYTPKQTETWLHKKWKEMKKKQTAVQWLIDHIMNPDGFPYNTPEELFEQAKEMEKQQIVKAAQDNFYAGQDLAKGYKIDWNSAEQYYNETYKSE